MLEDIGKVLVMSVVGYIVLKTLGGFAAGACLVLLGYLFESGC